MKRKWRLFFFVVLLGLLASLCFYSVRVRLIPRVMLSQGLKNTFARLDARYQNSPVHLLEGILNMQGRQKAQLELEMEHPRLGITRCDMTVQTQFSPNRILAEGTVVTGGKALDLSLYLDEDFAAMSSRGLVEGKYYGITYDSFPEDIRSRDMVALLLGEKTLDDWEQSVANMKKTMSVDLNIPDFTIGDIQNVLFGILALKPRVERMQVSVDGETVTANVVRFFASGSEIAAAATEYLEQMPETLGQYVKEMEEDPESGMEAVFLLHKDQVIRVDMILLSGGVENSFMIEPGSDTLNFSISRREGSVLHRQLITVQTTQSTSVYEESIRFVSVDNGIWSQCDLQYAWDISSRELTAGINIGEKRASFRAHMERAEDQLTITSQDMSSVLNLLLKKPLQRPAICTLTVMPGTGVSTPEYRNLDQWSMEDLLALLAGIGGLLGLKTQS